MIVNISSRSASITSMPSTPPLSRRVTNITITACQGEDIGYRLSKVVLNMLTVTLAKEFQMNG